MAKNIADSFDVEYWKGKTYEDFKADFHGKIDNLLYLWEEIQKVGRIAPEKDVRQSTKPIKSTSKSDDKPVDVGNITGSGSDSEDNTTEHAEPALSEGD